MIVPFGYNPWQAATTFWRTWLGSESFVGDKSYILF